MKPTLLVVYSLLASVCATFAAPRPDAEADGKTVVLCRGVVVAYKPRAIHDHFADGRFDSSDETTIQLNAPAEWKGRLLRVASKSLPTGNVLTKEGATIAFKIPKVYLVQEYPQPNGTTNSYHAGDGALQLLEAKPNNRRKPIQ